MVPDGFCLRHVEDFLTYFQGRDRGYAIHLGELTWYPEAVNPWLADDCFRPAQSFRYVESDSLLWLVSVNKEETG